MLIVNGNLQPSGTMNAQENGHVRYRSEKYGKMSNFEAFVNKEDEDRLKEWKRTRRLGFMSFVIPVSIIFVLSTGFPIYKMKQSRSRQRITQPVKQ